MSLQTPAIVFILLYNPDYIISHVVTGTGSLALIDGSVMKAVVELSWVVVSR